MHLVEIKELKKQLINIDINEVAKFIDFLTKFPYFAIETKTLII